MRRYNGTHLVVADACAASMQIGGSFDTRIAVEFTPRFARAVIEQRRRPAFGRRASSA